jgi:hypothetical protein
MKLLIKQIEFHRNGISGAPFHIVSFDDDNQRRMVGIVFNEPYHVAVFDVDELAVGNITFGSNSFRGDQFEPTLRRVIAATLTGEA